MGKVFVHGGNNQGGKTAPEKEDPLIAKGGGVVKTSEADLIETACPQSIEGQQALYDANE